MSKLAVGVKGMYSFTRVRNNNDLRHFGSGITIKTLDSWGLNTDQVWVVNKPLEIFIAEGDQISKYYFMPPHVTDLASVPKFLRGLVDNDDLRIIAPALVHDYNFATHAMGFRESNRLFRRMIKAQGGSWWLRVAAWIAVTSPIGKWCYKRYHSARAAYYKTTCEVKHRRLY